MDIKKLKIPSQCDREAMIQSIAKDALSVFTGIRRTIERIQYEEVEFKRANPNWVMCNRDRVRIVRLQKELRSYLQCKIQYLAHQGIDVTHNELIEALYAETIKSWIRTGGEVP